LAAVSVNVTPGKFGTVTAIESTSAQERRSAERQTMKFPASAKRVKARSPLASRRGDLAIGKSVTWTPAFFKSSSTGHRNWFPAGSTSCFSLWRVGGDGVPKEGKLRRLSSPSGSSKRVNRLK